jgi:hypothetical protein
MGRNRALEVLLSSNDIGEEARVDLALLSAADLVDESSHVVVDAPPRHVPQDAEGVVMGV